jgi:hypothetical protein
MRRTAIPARDAVMRVGSDDPPKQGAPLRFVNR